MATRKITKKPVSQLSQCNSSNKKLRILWALIGCVFLLFGLCVFQYGSMERKLVERSFVLHYDRNFNDGVAYDDRQKLMEDSVSAMSLGDHKWEIHYVVVRNGMAKEMLSRAYFNERGYADSYR